MPFPIQEKYIAAAEEELGVAFPDDFKAKMIKENGGELTAAGDDWQAFPFFDRSDNKRISRTANHIIAETKQARRWGNFPENGIAIASNGSGDLLVLLPTKENEKKLGEEIFVWLHETGETKKAAGNIEELSAATAKPIIKKLQTKKQKLDSLHTDFGFRIAKVPSPWVLKETIVRNKPAYTFQMGKGTDCIVGLATQFPADESDNDEYWLDLWVKETGLKQNLDDLAVERQNVGDYACIIVRSKNWTPVYYWLKNNFTNKWYLKMKTTISRHKGDFKEFAKVLNNIAVDEK